MKLHSLNIVALTFGFAVFFFVFGHFAIYFFTHENLEESGYWVEHTHRVIEENQKLYITLLNAETGQRGYLLTKDPSYLDPFNESIVNSGRVLKRLKELTQDNPEQQVRLDRLEEVVTEKYDEFLLTITLTQKSLLDEALKIVNTNQGYLLMEEIRELIAAINQAEELLLLNRESELNESLKKEGFLVNVLFGVTILLLVLAYLYLNKFIIKPIAKTTKKFNLLVMMRFLVHMNKS